MKMNILYKSITLYFVILLIFRIFLGVELTDESQYAAQAIQPLNGGSFFQFDLFIQQFIYIIFYPVTRLYYHLYGSEGIILFFRFCYLLLTILSSFLLFITCRKILTWQTAFFCSVSLFSFIPFSVPAISYNTIIYLFSPLLFASITFVKKPKIQYHLLIAFLTFLLNLSYPTIGVVFVGIVIYLFLGKKFEVMGSLIIGGVGAFILAFFFIEEVLVSIQFSSLFNKPSPFEKIFLIWNRGLYLAFVMAQSFGLALMKIKNGKYLPSLTVLLFLFNIAVFQKTAHYGHSLILVYASMFIPGLLLLKVNKKTQMFIILSCFTSLVLAYTSSNGVTNSPLALIVPSVIASGFYLSKNYFFKFNLLVLFLLSISNYAYFYREARLIDLNSLVKSGPFKGLITTAERETELKEIERILRDRTNKHAIPVLSLGSPSIYLFPETKPKTKMLFIHHGEIAEKVFEIIADCKMFSQKPGLVFIHNYISENTKKSFDKCLEFKKNYSELRKTSYFSVFELSE